MKSKKIASFLIGLSIVFSTYAQDFNQIIKLVASDRANGDYFGAKVAIDGDYAVVSAYLESEDANGLNTLTNAGSAYVFKRNTTTGNWTQIKKLVASDRAASDRFGFSVDISGDNIVVGAYLEDEDASGLNTLSAAGSVYIFNRNQGGTDNWGQVRKIVASDRAVDDQFGWSVAISGDHVVVGAPQEDEDASGLNTLNNSGSAYVFNRNQGGTNNWGQVRKIVASDRDNSDFFGYSLAISSDNIVIGAYLEDEDANGSNTLTSSGSAYIFNQNQGGTNNWGQVRKIVASDRASADYFGFGVAISGDDIVVGAYLEDEDANGSNTLTNSGSAYIFNRNQGGTNNWGQVRKIVASDRASSDNFGFSVAISGDNVIVGAHLEDEDANGTNTITNSGSAYIFNRNQGGANNWGQIKKLTASDRASADNFGYNVSISGNYVLVGAYLEDEDASGSNTMLSAGSAYIFGNEGLDYTVIKGCAGNNNSSVQVNQFNVGSAPYSYIWNSSPAQTTSTVTGLSVSSVVLTITDASSNVFLFPFTLYQFPALNVSSSIKTSCFGQDTASITMTASGGAGPGTYNYTWSHGPTTQTVSNLSPDNYSVTVSSQTCLFNDTYNINDELPKLVTSQVYYNTSTSVKVDVNIFCEGISSISQKGVCWNTTGNPTLSDNFTNDGSGVESFISTVSGLSLNTTYYFRSYVINSQGTTYGNQTSYYNGITQHCSSTGMSNRGYMYNFSVYGEDGSSIVNNAYATACTGYADLTNNMVAFFPNNSYTIDYLVQKCTGPCTQARINIYIDWNRNGSFYDPEDMVETNVRGFGQAATKVITVPSNVQYGLTRMRVMVENCDYGVINPCAMGYTGETHDYAVLIIPPYCEVNGLSGANGYMKTVSFNDINRTSTFDGYVEPNNTTTILKDNTYELSLTRYNATANGGWAAAWIDWNGDRDFSNPGEQVMTPVKINSVGDQVTTVNVQVPVSAISGQVRMRVVWKDGNLSAPTACDTYGNYIDWEDYDITIETPPLPPTVNGGWVQLSSGTSQNLTSLYQFNEDSVVVVGSSGTILRTDNKGSDWNVITSPTTNNFTGTHFPSNDIGYAITYQGNVAQTTNNGTSWSLVGTTGMATISSGVFFVSESSGTYVGNNNLVMGQSITDVYATTNSGASVTQTYQVTSYNYFGKSVYFIDGNIGFFTNTYGNVYKSTNGGGTWTTNYTYSQVRSLNGIHFPDNNTGYIVGSSGVILKTTNQGASWTDISYGTSTYNSVYFLSTTEGYVVGSAGKIIYTTDGGSSWTDVPSGTSSTLNAIMYKDGKGYIVGDNGVILTTSELVCEVLGNDDSGGYVKQVQLNTLNRSSNYDGFVNALSTTELFIGETYTLNVKQHNNAASGGWTAVWIDWNKDGNFDGGGEEILAPVKNTNVGEYTRTVDITVPTNTSTGGVLMRVVWKDGNETAPTSCDTYNQKIDWEDYAINLANNCIVATETITNVSCFGGSDGSIAITHDGIPNITYEQIGFGTSVNTNSGYPAPYGNYYWGAKHQYLIQAGEISQINTAIGSLAFNVINLVTTPLEGFTIRMKNTGSVSLTTTFESGANLVYGPITYTPVSGWNTHVFDTPFEWDGVSNILVEICFNNSAWTNNCGIQYTSTAFTSASFVRADNTSTICSAGSTSGTSSFRANMRLGYGFNYTWSNNETTKDISGLSAGSYSVIIDDGACQQEKTYEVTQPDELLVSGFSNATSCFSSVDGSITANVSGGVEPYTYLWNDAFSQTTATATGLSSSNYIVTVTDMNTCLEASEMIFVAQPDELMLNLYGYNTSCLNTCDGSAEAEPSGGTSPYSYQWDDAMAQTTMIVTGLCPGNYSVTVTDANGCTNSLMIGVGAGGARNEWDLIQ
jgi:photosystem II stability/assembly factor-like uncharacterized protein